MKTVIFLSKKTIYNHENCNLFKQYTIIKTVTFLSKKQHTIMKIVIFLCKKTLYNHETCNLFKQEKHPKDRSIQSRSIKTLTFM